MLTPLMISVNLLMLGGYKHALDYLALSAPAFSTPIKGVLFGYQDSSDSNF